MTKEILEEFRKKFPHLAKPCECCGGIAFTHWKGDEVQNFLSSALEKQKAEIVKVLEGMKQSKYGNDDGSFQSNAISNALTDAKNKALDQAISKIKEL